MNTYKLTWLETVKYVGHVEAESEDAALRAVYKRKISADCQYGQGDIDCVTAEINHTKLQRADCMKKDTETPVGYARRIEEQEIKKELVEALECHLESLLDLYSAHPKIAGEFFGSAQCERLKEVLAKARGES